MALPGIAGLTGYAVEEFMINTLIVFAAAVFTGVLIVRLRRRHGISKIAAWVIFGVVFTAIVGLSVLLDVATRMAPLLARYL